MIIPSDAGWSGLRALPGDVAELDDAVGERLGPGELERQATYVDALEQPQPAAHRQREDREVEFIDETMVICPELSGQRICG
jgi:hypothetical protein